MESMVKFETSVNGSDFALIGEWDLRWLLENAKAQIASDLKALDINEGMYRHLEKEFKKIEATLEAIENEGLKRITRLGD